MMHYLATTQQVSRFGAKSLAEVTSAATQNLATSIHCNIGSEITKKSTKAGKAWYRLLVGLTQGTRKQFENHPNYKLFAPLFFDTIDMINLRVIFVHNQDVCRLLTQNRGNLMKQALRMMVVRLLVATAGAAEHKWDLGVAKAVLKETEDRFRELGLNQRFQDSQQIYPVYTSQLTSKQVLLWLAKVTTATAGEDECGNSWLQWVEDSHSVMLAPSPNLARLGNTLGSYLTINNQAGDFQSPHFIELQNTIAATITLQVSATKTMEEVLWNPYNADYIISCHYTVMTRMNQAAGESSRSILLSWQG
ncbi:hypothetical protein HD553DRAFT_325114 [Filobasidium floriforme]|uniref:uncharacterized protein n=1 Tax=Filobasidium floriforme TaxID=5210 RepID=UPI001E8D9B12|nr:uncharacterized protein HD553DRAFT_325114 [Filobasidium floriforme]KAH8082270.1 hypothetical protein HD553DRAFT_325114 [Filobasidium floriforme]